jgi:hypothetical protein
VWCFCRPLALFSAISHTEPPPLLPPFRCSLAHAVAPCGCVQRTGCGACGLGYPHQVWWALPMYIVHSSCLAPVSFASFLIKCITPLVGPPQLSPWNSPPSSYVAFIRRLGNLSLSRGVVAPVFSFLVLFPRLRPQPINCIAPALFAWLWGGLPCFLFLVFISTPTPAAQQAAPSRRLYSPVRGTPACTYFPLSFYFSSPPPGGGGVWGSSPVSRGVVARCFVLILHSLVLLLPPPPPS